MSKDLAVKNSGTLASLDLFDSIIKGDLSADEIPQVVDDPQEISREIIEQLLAAETDEEVFGIQKAEGWRDLEGVPVEIFDFRWRPSTLESGEGDVFVVVTGRAFDVINGRGVVLTTGSRNVLAQLSNLARREIQGTGKLRGKVLKVVAAERPTASGYRPLHLEKVADTVEEFQAA